MLPDRVSNPGPLTYESGALPIALRGPAVGILTFMSRKNSMLGLHEPKKQPNSLIFLYL